MKTVSDKKKMKEFITTRTDLQKLLEEVIQAGKKIKLQFSNQKSYESI